MGTRSALECGYTISFRFGGWGWGGRGKRRFIYIKLLGDGVISVTLVTALLVVCVPTNEHFARREYKYVIIVLGTLSRGTITGRYNARAIVVHRPAF